MVPLPSVTGVLVIGVPPLIASDPMLLPVAGIVPDVPLVIGKVCT